MQTSQNNLTLIDKIRNDSRQMVRELGFMKSTLAATDYSPSVVHTILELGICGTLSSAQLAESLKLEKSSVSRLVGKLVHLGVINENISPNDARVKLLELTQSGQNMFVQVQEYGRNQVTQAFSYLSTNEHEIVQQGLALYAQALESHRLGRSVVVRDNVEIVSGYRAGAIARITEMHINFYSRHSGFGQYFESQVASGLAEFAGRLMNPRNGLWLAVCAGRIVGSVAIDGEDMGENRAHLRWFIIDDGLRGAGIGRQLMTHAMNFCDREGFLETHLWTFQGLNAARRLYEDFGFSVIEERAGKQWGEEVVEQCFVRPQITS